MAVVVVDVVMVEVLVVLVEVLVVLDEVELDVFDEVVELDEEDPPVVVDVVEPMSPHRMLEKMTCVFGSWDRMVAGLPAVLLQGPLLPLSSQFMNCELSFQMEKARTMPRPRASPIVVKPPYDWADVHDAAVMVSPVDTALWTATPFWMYLRVMFTRVPVVVPSLVMNCVVMVKTLLVSTVSPGPQ